MARQGVARQGRAWVACDIDWSDRHRSGFDYQTNRERRGAAWIGEAGRGAAGLGSARFGRGCLQHSTKGKTAEMELHPIDFEALQKGEVIPAQRLREIYGTEEETELAFKRMGLVQEIEMRRSDLYPVIRDECIVILTDHEAAEYSVKRHEQLVRGMQRNARRRSRIDSTEFSDAEKRSVEFWDQQIVAQSLGIQRQLRQAKRDLLLSAAPEESSK